MNVAMEKYVIDRFKNLYPAFPDGILESKKPPLPDFLLITKDGLRIGIELTQAMNNEEETKAIAFREKIGDLVLEKLDPHLPFTFDISLNTDSDISLSKKEVKKLVDELVIVGVEEFYELENYQRIKLTNFSANIGDFPPSVQSRILKDGYRNLPKGIESIAVHRFDSVGKSWNSKGGGLVVPHFTDEYLEPILEKKHRKLMNYRGCDQYWLVIWDSGYVNSYFYDIKVTKPIETPFNKIFFSRNMQGEVIVLK